MTTITNGATSYSAGIIGSKKPGLVQLQGTFFYLTVASGPLFVKPNGGNWTLYYSGMGTNVAGGFSGIQLYNPTSNPVTYQMVSGESEFIDKRQILNTQTPSVINIPGWTRNGTTAACSVPDLSGLTFADQFGVSWLAIQRLSLNIQTLTPGDLCTLQQNGNNVLTVESFVLGATAGGIVFDQVSPPQVLQVSGAFTASITFANTFGLSPTPTTLPALFEIYAAVAPNSTAYQPPN
jgi:hypothetical protein